MVLGSEIARVCVFFAAVAAVFALAAFVLARRVLRKQPLHRFGRAVVFLAVLGLGCIAYGRYVEPRWVEVTRTRVTTARLPAGHRGVRIVHLSDLHSDAKPLLETGLPARIAQLQPDLIVFTGDCANSPEGFVVFRSCLADLAKIAPTFAVRGNWDSLPSGDNYFEGTGATELDGTSATVEVAGARVHVVGVGANGSSASFDRALQALPADGPAIVLHHFPYPDLVPPARAARVDLMCAGHVHGGQVALPFYGALLTLSKHGKRFERGFYPTADGFGFPLYVSRGLGMEGSGAPRVRFCSRPEVALIELVPGTSGAPSSR